MRKRTLLGSIVCTLILQLPALASADPEMLSGVAALPLPATSADFYDNGAPNAGKVKLGAQLFFDKILSGNKNIACATCHHPFAGTGDGLSLPVGEGGRGFGVTRDTGAGAEAIHERVPRNAPALFNLGAREFTHLFHDGRVQSNGAMPNGIESPAGLDLPEGLDNVLAAQAMFPVTSPTEMAWQVGENSLADAAAAGDPARAGTLFEMAMEISPTFAASLTNSSIWAVTGQMAAAGCSKVSRLSPAAPAA